MRKLKSYLTCEHYNADGYTQYCPDCGYNIYTTEEEYLKDLREKTYSRKDEIKRLEKQLGIES